MDSVITNIFVISLAATTFAKVLVDITKLSFIPSPSKLLPVLSLGYGIAATFLLMGAAGTLRADTQNISLAVLAGILAGGGAIGVTEMQNKAKEVNR